jgi:mannose/fructose/N-acetylgalactosamine-specific phosphotransferase system component IIC
MTPSEIAWLLVWGTLVGIDLASIPQVMIARPLVAGTIAGAIVGDPAAGLAVGAVLELFALEVMPVGAVRYPDYGPAAVGGVVLVAGTEGLHGVGLAVSVGMLVAFVGDFTIHVMRWFNTESVRRRAGRLDIGDSAAVRVIQRLGLARDAVRSFTLTLFGLLVAWAVRSSPPLGPDGSQLVDTVVLGAALASATAGALRLSGRWTGIRWLALGIAAGVGVILLR